MENPRLLKILRQQIQRREDLAEQDKFYHPTVESCGYETCALNPLTRIYHMYGPQVYDHITQGFWWSEN